MCGVYFPLTGNYNSKNIYSLALSEMLFQYHNYCINYDSATI